IGPSWSDSLLYSHPEGPGMRALSSIPRRKRRMLKRLHPTIQPPEPTFVSTGPPDVPSRIGFEALPEAAERNLLLHDLVRPLVDHRDSGIYQMSCRPVLEGIAVGSEDLHCSVGRVKGRVRGEVLRFCDGYVGDLP